MSKTGWVFSSRVFISGEQWMPGHKDYDEILEGEKLARQMLHDWATQKKEEMSQLIDKQKEQNPISTDAFKKMEAEFKRRYEERQAKLMAHFKGDGTPITIIKHDMEGDVQMVGETRQSVQGGFTPRATRSEFKASDAIALLYGITIPFMTGMAAGTGHPWNEALGLGIIWPLWIPFEVGKAIGRLLELLP